MVAFPELFKQGNFLGTSGMIIPKLDIFFETLEWLPTNIKVLLALCSVILAQYEASQFVIPNFR